MSLVNNIFEFPSDAFKIVTHFRHPLPQRTDTIGPWLDCLSFLAWFSALTNSALVYLFRPQGTVISTPIPETSAAAAGIPAEGHVDIQRAKMQQVLTHTLFIALAASHGFILLRAVVRHVLERVMWYGSEEKKRLDNAAREIKEQYVQSIERRDGTIGGGGAPPLVSGANCSTESTITAPVALPSAAGVAEEGQKIEESSAGDEFWQFDEGLDEIRKGIKDS
jgi:anoctamin-10